MNVTPFLTRVVLENYKSIAACDVPLGPLTYLVGPNGAGKSNFFDALRFVADALTFSLEQALLNRFNADHLLHRSERGRANHFSIRVEFRLPSDKAGHYFFQIGLNNADYWEVQKEECVIVAQANPELTDCSFSRNYPDVVEIKETSSRLSVMGDRLFLASAAATNYRVLFEHLARMRFYNPIPENISNFLSKGVGGFLNSQGSNIRSIVNHLHKKHADELKHIEDYLAIILPGFRSVDVIDIGPGQMLRFWQAPAMACCRSRFLLRKYQEVLCGPLQFWWLFTSCAAGRPTPRAGGYRRTRSPDSPVGVGGSARRHERSQPEHSGARDHAQFRFTRR